MDASCRAAGRVGTRLHERRLRDLELRLDGDDRAPDYSGGFAFLVTFGRSGSTLLQGHLNALPGWLIRGENGGAVEMYVAATQQAIAIADLRAFDGPIPDSGWYGLHQISPEHLRLHTRRLVLGEILQPEPETRVCGFKDIRWRAAGLVPLLEEMREIFPGARFVMNVRSPEATARSGWWRDDAHALETITTHVEALKDAADALGDAAFLVHYEDYATDVTRLRPLIQWLGEDFDEPAHRRIAAHRLLHLQDGSRT